MVVEEVVVELLQVLVVQEIHLLLVRLKEIMVEMDHRVVKTLVVVVVELVDIQILVQEVEQDVIQKLVEQVAQE